MTAIDWSEVYRVSVVAVMMAALAVTVVTVAVWEHRERRDLDAMTHAGQERQALGRTARR